MREVLLERVRPLAERLAQDMVNVATARIEAEIERIGEAFEVALSAFASEVPHDDSDRRVDDPLPKVPSGARRQLHGDEPRGASRADSVAVDGAYEEQPAQNAGEGRGDGERSARPVALSVSVPSDIRKQNVCSKCGFVGGNARGCGTAHRSARAPVTTTPERPRPITAAAIAAAKVRNTERIASIAKRETVRARAGSPGPRSDDNQNAEERWTPQGITEERELDFEVGS
jgi:hypothetical protein